MAGDWIKMRVDLQTHPKVVRILSATGTNKFQVLGGLHAVWSVFDTHSEDGRLKGYTPETLDHVIGWPGFGAAMMAVNWLAQEDGETLVLPEFSEHNGQSAKRRAEDQKRKRNARRESEDDRTDCGQIADTERTRDREEKRREEQKQQAVPVCPHQQIIDSYHERLPMLPAVKVWNEQRAKVLRCRWREDTERQTVGWWDRYFGYVAGVPFLVGKGQSRGDAPPFMANFDWLLKSGNMPKVIEGNYE